MGTNRRCPFVDKGGHPIKELAKRVVFKGIDASSLILDASKGYFFRPIKRFYCKAIPMKMLLST